ncbi:WD repeat-containing protein 18 [Cajanus cajan]|uniref:WD repeat-containing protein 18 n=1 Tax=Cajanus cajan TaxID=3821 RepID=UPI00098DAF70|nr:WD repeat-containing protein 18 [Cajanus cajan]
MSSSSLELILTSSPDGPIITYEAVTGTTVAKFSGSRIPCRGLATVNRGLIAASHVSLDTGAGWINVYNWYGSTAFHNFPVPEPVAPLIAYPDGEFLFAGGISGSVFCLSVSSGEVIRSYAAHSKAVSSLHLSDDRSLVISGSEDGTIVVVPTFKVVVEAFTEEDLIFHKWKAHSDSVTAFNSGMGTLVSCSMDCTCKFWSQGSNGDLIRTVAFPCAIFGVALDSLGLGFHAAGADGLVYEGVVKDESMESLGGGYEVNAWSKRHGGSIVSLALLNEGKNLVSASEDGNVWVWDVEKGEVTMVLGNEMVSISDMIVAKGSGDFGVRKGNNIEVGDGSSGFFTSSGLCHEEMIKTMKQITEIEEDWDVLVQNKKRAIEMLESAIETYERLLKLILKEATKAIEVGEEEEEEEEQVKDDGKKEDN